MSTHLGIESTELQKLSAIMTATEIEQQPSSWISALVSLENQKQEVLEFIKPVLQASNGRVIFTGAGTSAFAGHALSPFVSELTQKRIESIATTNIVSNPHQYFSEDVPTLLISFARSGNSPESNAAVEIADQFLSKCRHLLITCNPEGQLYKQNQHKDNVLGLLMPPETNDGGFAMTSSFSSMTLAALCVFCLETGSIVAKFKDIAEKTIKLLPIYVSYVQELVKTPIERIIYLGSGGLQGLAQESALKILELTAGKVVATYDSPMGFRHGPKSIVNENTLVVEYFSNHPYTRLYDYDLYAELVRDNKAKKVIALSAQKLDDSTNKGNVLHVAGFEESQDFELIFPYVVFAQTYALYSSLANNITPDNPCPTGEVNRVVQGVTIHPASF